jgi:hypothetical protein
VSSAVAQAEAVGAAHQHRLLSLKKATEESQSCVQYTFNRLCEQEREAQNLHGMLQEEVDMALYEHDRLQAKQSQTEIKRGSLFF